MMPPKENPTAPPDVSSAPPPPTTPPGERSAATSPLDAALANLVVVLADNKYFLGRRLSESAIGAPTLESAVACAAIAQEELGHTRPLYSFLEQLPAAPVPLERDDDRERKYCLTLLRQRFPTWPHAVAALFLVDAAVTIMLEGLEQAGPDVLRRRAARIVADEPTHSKFAVGRVRELAASPAAPDFQASAVQLLPELLCWFGPAGESGLDALLAAGLVELDNERLRQRFLSRVVPLLADLGLDVRIAWDAARESWEYGTLPWETWNSLERRLTPTPSGGRP
jgi:ring-1,2-phenylacetyl-CoA epoxidase subunit PaaC